MFGISKLPSTPKSTHSFDSDDFEVGGSNKSGSPDSDLSGIIKDGKADLEMGKKVLDDVFKTKEDDEEMGGENAHKKRSVSDLQSDEENSNNNTEKKVWASQDDPIHIFNRLPPATKQSIFSLSTIKEKHSALNWYLERQLLRFSTLQQAYVKNQPTELTKFEKLLEFLQKRGEGLEDVAFSY